MDTPVIKPASKKSRKKSKKPDRRPARQKYWMARSLERNKIRNLMKCCGMTRVEAIEFWINGKETDDGHHPGRTRRVKQNFFRA
jgi:hypothetical protein